MASPPPCSHRLREEIGHRLGRAVGGADAPLLRIEIVEPVAHALGLAKGNVAIGDGDDAARRGNVQGFAPQIGYGLGIVQLQQGIGRLPAGVVSFFARFGYDVQRAAQLGQEAGGRGCSAFRGMVRRGGLAQGSHVDAFPAVAAGEEVPLVEQLHAAVPDKPADLLLVLVAVEGAGGVDQQAAVP